MIKNIIFEEIISDIAGNKFILIAYTDIDGSLKKTIQPYDPNTEKYKNKTIISSSSN